MLDGRFSMQAVATMVAPIGDGQRSRCAVPTAAFGSRPDALEVRVRAPVGHDTTVEAVGEVDVASVHHLRSALAHAVTGTAARRVVVDLAGVTFIDGKGIALLDEVSRRVAGDGRRLVVRRPSPVVGRVLAATRVALAVE